MPAQRPNLYPASFFDPIWINLSKKDVFYFQLKRVTVKSVLLLSLGKSKVKAILSKGIILWVRPRE